MSDYEVEMGVPPKRSEVRNLQPYWWVTKMHEGRPVILGPLESEEEANRLGFDKLGGDFEAFMLLTRDRAKATSIVKARILERTSNLDKALRRASHQAVS